MSDEIPGLPGGGRRERAKREKRERIVARAAELFTKRGYDHVSTQELAEAADIGTGTLFRYFPSKADLLLELMGVGIQVGIAQAIDAAQAGVDPVDAIVALITPLTRAGVEQPENVVAYLRETLFGAAHVRAIGSSQGMAMADAIERVLDRYASSRPVREGVNRRDVADAIYARVWLEGIRLVTQGQAIDAQRARHTIEFLVRELLLPHPSEER
jgi:TetR/AcrR family transcriptional regulator, cholesterol catabolism regulator